MADEKQNEEECVKVLVSLKKSELAEVKELTGSSQNACAVMSAMRKGMWVLKKANDLIEKSLDEKASDIIDSAKEGSQNGK